METALSLVLQSHKDVKDYVEKRHGDYKKG